MNVANTIHVVVDHFGYGFLVLVTEMLVNVLNLKGGDDEDLDSDEDEQQGMLLLICFSLLS